MVGRKKKGKDSRGPAITRAGAGLVPVGEVPNHVVKPGSGHPASISNFPDQILYAGEPTTCRSRVVRTGGNTGEEEQASESEQGVDPEQTEDSARTVSEARSLSQEGTHPSVEADAETQAGPPKKKRKVYKLSELPPKPTSASVPASDALLLEAPMPDLGAETTEAVHPPHRGSPVHAEEPVSVENATAEGATVEDNRGKQVVDPSVHEVIDDDEEMDETEVNLKDWASSAFPGQVENLCTGIDLVIANFAKEQDSSPLPALPAIPVTDASISGSSAQDQTCLEEPKFSSIQRSKETAHLGQSSSR